MSWILSATSVLQMTASGVAIAKAGTNANSDVIASQAILAVWSDQAEAKLSMKSNRDWVADFDGVKANFKQVLSEYVPNDIAISIINYDMRDYNSLLEATTMIDVLNDRNSNIISDLRQSTYQDIMI